MQVEQVGPAVAKAKIAAQVATENFLATHGDRDSCGFAWATVYDVKLSTKVGKAFAAAGFSKAYGGGIQIWNPSGNWTQAITAKEKGAEAFCEVLRAEFPGIKAYAGSRMD
jgi:ribosomal protein S27AE